MSRRRSLCSAARAAGAWVSASGFQIMPGLSGAGAAREMLIDRAMVAQADRLALDEEHRAGVVRAAGGRLSYSTSNATRRAGSVSRSSA